MFMSRKILAGGVAGFALLASAGAALAYPAEATAAVNVRSGPGTGYAIVGALSPGEGVNVRTCASGWCLVADAGPSGWVSGAYLAGAGAAPAVYAPAYLPGQLDYPDYAGPPVTYVQNPWPVHRHDGHPWHQRVASGGHWSGGHPAPRHIATIDTGGHSGHHRQG